MKLLDTFLMEEELEKNRFQARFNLGESGHRPRTVQDLLLKSGVSREQACDTLLNMSLRDSPNWGRLDLREAIASLHAEGHATAGNVLVTTGTSEALLLLFRALAPRKVALVLPAFQVLTEIPQALGAAIVGLPLSWSATALPSVDLECWRALLESEKPDVVVLNTPHNPSGIVFSQTVESMILDYCERQGATLIADEHYRFLAHETLAAVPTLFRHAPQFKRARIFVTGSFIKCVGAPGLRIGWCVGDPAVLAQMQNEKNYTTRTVNPLSEWIAFEVLKNLNSPLFHEVRSEWCENKKALAAFLKQSKCWQGAAPQGGLVSLLAAQQDAFSGDFSLVSHHLYARSIFILPIAVMVFKDSFPQKFFSTAVFRLGLGSAPHDFASALEALEAGS